MTQIAAQRLPDTEDRHEHGRERAEDDLTSHRLKSSPTPTSRATRRWPSGPSGDLAGFWAAQAEEFEWFQKWDKVLDDSNAPFYKWFVGGKTNIVYNCLDRHVQTWRRNKLALIWEGENGEVRTFSYHALNREVCKFANVLRSMGVKKGDRVTIYMGRVPELPIAMLACAKIGAVHSVVYGGFSVEALHGRIEDSQSNVAHHLRRQLHERQDRRAEEDRRRGAQARRRPSST